MLLAMQGCELSDCFAVQILCVATDPLREPDSTVVRYVADPEVTSRAILAAIDWCTWVSYFGVVKHAGLLTCCKQSLCRFFVPCILHLPITAHLQYKSAHRVRHFVFYVPLMLYMPITAQLKWNIA